MFAIIEIAGKQFRVEKEKIFKVPHVNIEVGKSIEFDRVLLLNNDKETKIGLPLVKGAKVSAEVIAHGKDKKVIVFKKKRRKGYQVKRGHRQLYSKVQIKNIV
jgi:large subunit ribosomal protein L21